MLGHRQIVNNEKQPRKYMKKAMIIGGLMVVTMIIAIISLSIYVGWNLVTPEPSLVNETPLDYGMQYEEIQFQSLHDNIMLKGWWIPAQAEGEKIEAEHTVIFAHGYRNNRLQSNIAALNLAARLTEEGYHVLTFDFRRSGESEGDFSTIGLYEMYDLLAAVDFAKNEHQSEKVSVVGWSMGATTAIMAAAQSDDIAAVVADSPFSDLKEYLEVNLPHWSDLPSFPFTPIIMNTIPMIADLTPEKVSPYRAVQDWGEARLLLIHSQADVAIPYTESVRIFEAAGQPELVDLWLTSEGDHIQSFVTNDEEYVERVLSLLAEVTDR